MTKLLDPSPGEILDRLTILSLKIVHGRDQNKSVEHFVAERAALITKLSTVDFRKPTDALIFDLGATNAALWQAEDDFRRERVNKGSLLYSLHRAADIAEQIQSLNDQRAELIDEINNNLGICVGKEKL